ncbi:MULTISPECIES: hypothetical protein [Pyrobaculum]|uniref:hypothetical protein n=1 Tax=Pyrobaculum TaxID=2276 RepID=UPI000A60C770
MAPQPTWSCTRGKADRQVVETKKGVEHPDASLRGDCAVSRWRSALSSFPHKSAAPGHITI